MSAHTPVNGSSYIADDAAWNLEKHSASQPLLYHYVCNPYLLLVHIFLAGRFVIRVTCRRSLHVDARVHCPGRRPPPPRAERHGWALRRLSTRGTTLTW